ncbi:FadR/GntR family transcriptional regulator [Agromyces mediolanus]|uniref:HTH gntR-type domain-containing protein n=1 Tax=Agromyces mediolanus TaxID=41986 RepID=A0A918FCZ6_AGRME|nr:FCD domain-containing protein [Agromyces mediolanus]GGR28408.1 hypothetical protein GCM10010196_22740 [Agromyces mediolanus]GLJ72070.1 hypothetical protein GCM10017583_13260 [Agromyces mediolanus]
MVQPGIGELGDRRGAESWRLVAEMLRKRIALGGMEPGSKLPTERELSAILGVGRNTVRRAVRQLAQDGLVVTTLGRSGGTRLADGVRLGEVSVGERAVVAAEFRAAIRDYMEYRIILEPAVARLAAERGPTAARRSLVEMFDEEIADDADYQRIDTRFHFAIAEAAGNEPLRRAVEDARMEMFVRGNALWLGTEWSLVYREGISGAQIFEHEHRALALAILAGDGDAAERLMRAHLVESRDEFYALVSHFERLGV